MYSINSKAFAMHLPQFKFEFCTWFTSVDTSSESSVKPNHYNTCLYLHVHSINDKVLVLIHIRYGNKRTCL